MAETSASTSSIRAGLVSVGRVSGAHGVKGQLRIGLDADDADTLRDVTRLVLAGERPHAHAAERRTEGGVVDRDDRAQTGGVVVAEHHLLVVVLVDLLENAHG